MADFIQPSLGPLQPNLDDFMDTLEPLQGENQTLNWTSCRHSLLTGRWNFRNVIVLYDWVFIIFVELLSTPRLPPVPEESTLPADDPLYRSGMSVDSYSSQGYMTGNQNTVTMPTSQMSIHGMAQGACDFICYVLKCTVEVARSE